MGEPGIFCSISLDCCSLAAFIHCAKSLIWRALGAAAADCGAVSDSILGSKAGDTFRFEISIVIRINPSRRAFCVPSLQDIQQWFGAAHAHLHCRCLSGHLMHCAVFLNQNGSSPLSKPSSHDPDQALAAHSANPERALSNHNWAPQWPLRPEAV